MGIFSKKAPRNSNKILIKLFEKDDTNKNLVPAIQYIIKNKINPVYITILGTKPNEQTYILFKDYIIANLLNAGIKTCFISIEFFEEKLNVKLTDLQAEYKDFKIFFTV
jgi:hypothetical protein